MHTVRFLQHTVLNREQYLKDPNSDEYDIIERKKEIDDLNADLETRLTQMYEVDSILFGQNDIPKFVIQLK